MPSWNFVRSSKAVNDAVKELDPSKWLPIVMYGSDVNFLKFIQQDQKENEQHQLINIGSCGLHTIHSTFKTGAEKKLIGNGKDTQGSLSNISRFISKK